MAYLEQSTRYVPYTDRPNGRWKYHVPAEVERSPLAAEFRQHDRRRLRDLRRWIPAMEAHFRARYPKSPEDSDAVYRSVIRAKALDTLRGLLPAATTSNVGLFGTGQAFEALLLRMFAHPLEEVRGARRADARRAPPGDSGVPRARRSAGPRRPLDRVPRRHAARRSKRPRERSSILSPRSRAPEVTPDRFRSRRRDQGRRGGALPRVRPSRRSAAGGRPPADSG